MLNKRSIFAVIMFSVLTTSAIAAKPADDDCYSSETDRKTWTQFDVRKARIDAKQNFLDQYMNKHSDEWRTISQRLETLPKDLNTKFLDLLNRFTKATQESPRVCQSLFKLYEEMLQAEEYAIDLKVKTVTGIDVSGDKPLPP